MKAVVDTSALIHLFVVDPPREALAERLAQVVPHVPDIVDIEFHHALRGLYVGGKIRPDRAAQARTLFHQMRTLRYPSRLLTDRVWALRDKFGAYDACFIALAEVLAIPLISCDGKHAEPSLHGAAVECF